MRGTDEFASAAPRCTTLFASAYVSGTECPDRVGFEKRSCPPFLYHKKLIAIAFLSQLSSLTLEMLLYERRITVKMLLHTPTESVFARCCSSHMEYRPSLADDVYTVLGRCVQRFAALRKLELSL